MPDSPDIVALGVEPVGPAAPAGESVRFDPEFEQLSLQIAKVDSLTGAVVDWEVVTQLSINLLKSRSKDYRVASYLTFGLFQRKGHDGLLSALRMYKALLDNYWETGFPEKSRMRGRVGALEWLNDRLAAGLAKKDIRPPGDAVALELESAATEFVQKVADLLAADAPQFVELLSSASAFANDVRARQAAAESARQEKERRAQLLAAGEIIDQPSADKALDEARSRLFAVAAYLRSEDPSNPLPYRITRGTTWRWILAAPVHENGVTYLPAPEPSLAARMQECAASGDWLTIVREAEAVFADRIFDFDLQQHVLQALGELGESYAPAREAVEVELLDLIHRFPELPDLKFREGVPLAGEGTRKWLKERLRQQVPAGAASSDRQASPQEAELANAADEARRLLAAGSFQQAVGIMKAGIDRAPQRRLRFLWRLRLAKLCAEAGRPQLALPQLTSLDDEVVRFSLEEWEPDLSLEVVQQLFQCRQKLAASPMERPPEVEQQLSALYERLCRLDINAAAAVEL